MPDPNFYFVGGELDEFTIVSGSPTNNVTAGGFRSAYSRCGMDLGTTRIIDGIIAGTPNSVWLHLECIATTQILNTTRPIKIYHSSSGRWVGIRMVAASNLNGTPSIYSHDGSSETNHVTGASISWGSLRQVDIELQINGGSADVIRLYVDKILNCEITGINLGSTGGVNKIRLEGAGTSATLRYSEIIVVDVPTTDFALATLVPNGAGFHADWTGASTDIDELDVSDADVINGAANGDQFSCTLGNLDAGIEANVWAVIPRLRCSKGASGPSQIAVGARISSTTAYDATAILPSTSLASHQGVMLRNPITGLAWAGHTPVDAMELCLKALT